MCMDGKSVLIRNGLFCTVKQTVVLFQLFRSRTGAVEGDRDTVADPNITKLCRAEDFHPYPHIRPVTVPGASHWIQHEFPEVMVNEALKTVAELKRV